MGCPLSVRLRTLKNDMSLRASAHTGVESPSNFRYVWEIATSRNDSNIQEVFP